MKLIGATLRFFAAGTGGLCLFLAAGLLFQGVEQLEGEGLAKHPETPEEVQGRLTIGSLLFAMGFCCGLVFQAAGVFSEGLQGVSRPRVLKAVFEGILFWTGVCLFVCLLLLAGSVHARWEVAPAYYWLAGGTGGLALILSGAAGLVRQWHRTNERKKNAMLQRDDPDITDGDVHRP